jgi:hypothetical protein
MPPIIWLNRAPFDKSGGIWWHNKFSYATKEYGQLQPPFRIWWHKNAKIAKKHFIFLYLTPFIDLLRNEKSFRYFWLLTPPFFVAWPCIAVLFGGIRFFVVPPQILTSCQE